MLYLIILLPVFVLFFAFSKKIANTLGVGIGWTFLYIFFAFSIFLTGILVFYGGGRSAGIEAVLFLVLVSAFVPLIIIGGIKLMQFLFSWAFKTIFS